MLSSAKAIKRTKKNFILLSLLTVSLLIIVSYLLFEFYLVFFSHQQISQQLYSKLSKQLILVNRITALNNSLQTTKTPIEANQLKLELSQYVTEFSKEYNTFDKWLKRNSSPNIESVKDFLSKQQVHNKIERYLENIKPFRDFDPLSNDQTYLSSQNFMRDIGDVLSTVSYEISLKQEYSFLKLRQLGSLFVGIGVLQIVLLWLLIFRPLYQAIAIQHKKLIKSRIKAESANRTKTDFLANISHEIRTPMATILGYIDLLKNENLPPNERLTFTQIVHRNAEQLMSLIDEILDISKIESDNIKIQTKKVNFNSLLSEIKSHTKRKTDEKGLNLYFESEGEVPIEVTIDEKRVKKILHNIIGNAMKFTHYGSIEIISSFRKFEKKIIFTIKDTGIGIPNKLQENLFQHFQQADTTASRSHGGTGLGLVLSRGLARKMGGDVKIIQSRIGQGTTIEISIQNDAELSATKFSAQLSPSLYQQSDNPTITNTDNKSDPASLTGKKILVVDDAKENSRLFKLYLSEAGADVDMVHGGQEAIDLVKKKKFDLILLDLQMPGKNGFQVIEELRTGGLFNRPIVALTAHSMEEEREKTKKAGFNKHIVKPIKARDLVEAVFNLI